MRKLCFALFLALASPLAAQEVIGEYDHVVKVNVGSDGLLYIAVRGNFGPQHPCSNRAFAVSAHPLSDERTKAWLQISNASFLARAKVNVWTNGCQGGGNSGNPVMTKMQIVQ